MRPGHYKLLGNVTSFIPESHFLLTADTHNFVNGIRKYCQNKGSDYSYSPLKLEDLTINAAELNNQLSAHGYKENKLVAFPAQSNASGVQHSLKWIKKAHDLE